MIDVSAFNAFVLHTTANPTWNSGKVNKRRLFLEELGKNLVTEEQKRKVRLPRGFKPVVLGLSEAERAPVTDPPTVGSRRRLMRPCWICPGKMRVNTSCIKCRKQACRAHLVICCTSCWINRTAS